MKNEPAFPRLENLSEYTGVTGKHSGYRAESIGGLTKLEWFAGMALQGLLANSPGVPLDVHDEAIVAFEYAEAMLIEAEKRK